MTHCHLVFAALLTVPLFAGCAAPADDGAETATSMEALWGANGATYVLVGFDDGTSVLSGVDNQGRAFSSAYGGTTRFKTALLDRYAPTDPCRDAAATYNGFIAVNDTVGFNVLLASMAASSCKARVLVDASNVIKTFEPMP